MSDTPRTDAIAQRGTRDVGWTQYTVDLIELARELERELAAAHCELKDIRRQMRNLRA